MPCTYDTVRRIALAFPEVVEGRSYGTPAFHVRRKLMTRLWEDGETLVVKVDPADRPGFLEGSPDTFYLTDHYRNYPTMLVRLLHIHEDALSSVIEGAWRFTAPRKMVTAYGRPR